MTLIKPGKNILSAKAATGWGNTIDVRDFKNVTIEIATASSANLTAKIAASVSATAPTFSSAAAVGNVWDYVASYDLNDASKVDGDTGFVVAGTDDVKIYLVNTDGISWLSMNVTARSAGSITANLTGYAE